MQSRQHRHDVKSVQMIVMLQGTSQTRQLGPVWPAADGRGRDLLLAGCFAGLPDLASQQALRLPRCPAAWIPGCLVAS